MNPVELVQTVKEQVEKSANVRAIFGEPIEKGDVTVIPVARVRVCGGGGGGQGKSNHSPEEGSGGGLGFHLTASPVGYIEIANGTARFERWRLILSKIIQQRADELFFENGYTTGADRFRQFGRPTGGEWLRIE
jgi:uncharacterized spore protein YtfJ